MTYFKFWSDTNQRHFEEALRHRGVLFETTEDIYTIVVADAPDWVVTVAESLGADCS